MLAIEDLKKAVCDRVDRLATNLIAASDHLARNPEVGYREFETVALLRRLLEEQGIASEIGVAGLPTAFRADLPGRKARPCIAILAEYDALPGIGHGCGHNIIGVAAVGAAIALGGVMDSLPGSAVLFGTPCEESTTEGAGGKVPMVRQGLFDRVDAALMIHPHTRNMMSVESTLAARGFDMEFLGRAAHAAAAPHKGINALEAVIQTFNSVNALRQHLKPDVRVHGIITAGGKAVNIVPDYAACRFRIRAISVAGRDRVVEKVLRAAESAARSQGATFRYHESTNPYDNFVPNSHLNVVFRANLRALGLTMDVEPPGEGKGSTDYGIVSQRMPAACAYLAIAEPEIGLHSPEFAAATLSEAGHRALLNGAKAMAMTVIDLLMDPSLLAAARDEWSRSMAEFDRTAL